MTKYEKSTEWDLYIAIGRALAEHWEFEVVDITNDDYQACNSMYYTLGGILSETTATAEKFKALDRIEIGGEAIKVFVKCGKVNNSNPSYWIRVINEFSSYLFNTYPIEVHIGGIDADGNVLVHQAIVIRGEPQITYLGATQERVEYE